MEVLLAAWVLCSAGLVSATAWAEVARLLADDEALARHAFLIEEAKALRCLPRVHDPRGFLQID